jgi:hypothetical protein
MYDIRFTRLPAHGGFRRSGDPATFGAQSKPKPNGGLARLGNAPYLVWLSALRAGKIWRVKYKKTLKDTKVNNEKKSSLGLAPGRVPIHRDSIPRCLEMRRPSEFNGAKRLCMLQY